MLQKLLERLREIRNELGTDQVFDVVGEVFPANLLEKLFRDMYARRTDLPNIEARIVREVDAERFRKITNSTLEGLAKRELNLGRSSASRLRLVSVVSSPRSSRTSSPRQRQFQESTRDPCRRMGTSIESAGFLALCIPLVSGSKAGSES